MVGRRRSLVTTLVLAVAPCHCALLRPALPLASTAVAASAQRAAIVRADAARPMAARREPPRAERPGEEDAAADDAAADDAAADDATGGGAASAAAAAAAAGAAAGSSSTKVPIRPLASEAEYNALLKAARTENRFVCIKFHASWCRACKAVAPKFQRVANGWPDVEFYSILFDENKPLCKRLGIRVLPFIKIVAGSRGEQEGFTCGASKIARLSEKLDEAVNAEQVRAMDMF